MSPQYKHEPGVITADILCSRYLTSFQVFPLRFPLISLILSYVDTTSLFLPLYHVTTYTRATADQKALIKSTGALEHFCLLSLPTQVLIHAYGEPHFQLCDALKGRVKGWYSQQLPQTHRRACSKHIPVF